MDRKKNGLNDEEPTLLELFKRQFPEHSLTTAEERLFLEVEKGEVINYSSDDSADNDPGNAEEWGDERTISASAIAWLCTDRVAASRVTHKGIQVRGAKVVESLDLSFADVPFPLGLFGCALMGALSLLQSRIKALSLSGSHTQTIAADGIDVKVDVLLRSKFKAEGEVRLPGATIGGVLDCTKGQFIKPKGTALNAEGMDVKGDVFLRDEFKAEGEVRLSGATIGGQLSCTKGQFIKPKGTALNADGMDIKGSVLLSDGFKAEGRVSLFSTVVAQGLQVRDVLEPEKARFDFTATTIDTLWDDEASWPAKGNLVLDGFVYRRLDQQAPMMSKRGFDGFACNQLITSIHSPTSNWQRYYKRADVRTMLKEF